LERLKQILVFCLLLQCCHHCLAGIPVLPLPQLYTPGPQTLTYPSQVQFSSSTADGLTLQRMQECWNEFSPEFPLQENDKPATCQLILLGRDAKADAIAAAWLAAHRSSIGEEGYLLIMSDTLKLIAANTEAGLFYGMQTLRQLTRAQYRQSIIITDWPAFRYRIVMDDISRGPISTVDFIKAQIRRLAEIKINYLTFYIEHVIQTVSHPDIAPANGKLSIADIRELSAFAARYHIQLIGSFQSFGHFDKILALPVYRNMGATPNLIDPDNPKAKQFLSDMIGEIADAFSAPWFNVNCDETFDLGKGSSKAGVDSMGIAAYYAKHIHFLNSILQKHKKKMMLWGDIALQHEEILNMLPKDLIWLSWEYGTPASFDPWIQPFSKRGLPFMVCPGILNSNRLFPDHEMAVKNISGFAKAGKESGAMGVFTTIWDDGGASFFAGVWYSVYKAAEKSWNLQQQADKDFNPRYETVAYGNAQSNFTQSLHTFLQLRKLPLTWNMTDQPWYQSSLPAAARSLLLCNADLDSAEAILRRVMLMMPDSVKRNMDDLLALQMAMKQYDILLQWRKGLPVFMEEIQTTTRSSAIAFAGKKASLPNNWIQHQQALIDEARDRFTQLWLSENQPYWLDNARQPFDEKRKATEYLLQQLKAFNQLSEKKSVIPDSAAARLKVYATTHRYFQNWLFSGPFKGQQDQAPSFLYFPDTISTIPKPGDQFEYENKVYRWKKFASPTGGITYLEDQWPAGLNDADWVYAFASIHSDSERMLPAFLQAGKQAEVFCNGKNIAIQTRDQEQFFSNKKKNALQSGSGSLPMLQYPECHLQLPLTRGINYLLIKLPGNLPDKAFAFRLHPSVSVSNHKHKYYLNPNNSNHDAE
jgi:hypothetical protein